MSKLFTEMLKEYSKNKLKGISESLLTSEEYQKKLEESENAEDIIQEEPDTEEFEKELEVSIKKSEGKIRNKKIASPAVQAVEITKESQELQEKTLAQKEKEHKEAILRAMKKRSDRFIGQYGVKKFKQVMHATANKLSKEDIEFFDELDPLNEMDMAKVDHKKFQEHLKNNGYSLARTEGKHPVYQHESGKYSVTFVNSHNRTTHPAAYRKIDKQMRDNATTHEHEYHPIGSPPRKIKIKNLNSEE